MYSWSHSLHYGEERGRTWCPNSVISSDTVIMRRVDVDRRCTAGATVCTMVRGGGELGVQIPKSLPFI